MPPPSIETLQNSTRPASAAASSANAAAHNEAVFSALLEISNYVGSLMVLDDILEKIVKITTDTMLGQSCSIYLWNEDRSKLVMRCNIGLERELIGSAYFDRGRGIPGWVAEHGEVVALEEARQDPRHNPLPSTRDVDFRAYLCAPLRIQENIIGTMVLRRMDRHRFSPDEITVYETICKQVAIVIEKAQLYEARVEAEKLAAVAVSLSGVAHFTKNLLMTMKGGEYIVEAGLKRGDVKQALEGWAVLKRSTSKIREMVENMLNYYRDTDIHPRPVEFNTFLLEILGQLEDRAIERGALLLPDLDLRVEKIEIDADAIQDVLINMITNGLDALLPGRKGVVTVSTRLIEDQKRVRIIIKDNGAGIKPEDRPKLFRLFFSTKGKAGTGIGLAASKKLILDHHGTIEVESEPGTGTEFILDLPISQPRT